jgi:hypothetical protein
MTFRGTMRSLSAAARRMEREQRRRQRELERQRKQLEKMQELERAAFEVAEFENYIEVLQTVHKDCSDRWKWEEIIKSPPPEKPERRNENEKSAREEARLYKPGIGDKLLGRVETKQEKFEAEIRAAIAEDDRIFQEEMGSYDSELADWKHLQNLAKGIIAGDSQIMKKALSDLPVFGELEEIGSSVTPREVSSDFVDIELDVESDDVVPKEQKSLLKSGKLSEKAMPKSRFYEIYQDYVCSAVLRVSREIFALLPVRMVMVTACTNLLNSATGHLERSPILSVAIPRDTIEMMNFEAVDPSDSMANFIHNMDFKKTKGFAVVSKLDQNSLVES